MTNLNDVFDDPQMRDGPAHGRCRTCPRLMQEARGHAGKANEAFGGFKDVSERASRNLENLENFTKPLGERGPQMVDNLDGSLAEHQRSPGAARHLFRRPQQPRGNARPHPATTTSSIDGWITRWRTSKTSPPQVKPIVGDIRIFSDKIARDPSQILKLRSLMDRRPPGVGVKGTPTTGGHGPHHDQPIIVEGDAWDPVIVP